MQLFSHARVRLQFNPVKLFAFGLWPNHLYSCSAIQIVKIANPTFSNPYITLFACFSATGQPLAAPPPQGYTSHSLILSAANADCHICRPVRSPSDTLPAFELSCNWVPP